MTSTGTVTISIAPYTSYTTCPVTSSTYVLPPISPSYPHNTPVGTGSAPTVITSYSATKTPVSPSATTSGPAQVSAGAAIKVEAGFGAFAAAGLAALFL